ncbi:hypothetical protein U1Q18_046112 [Sarracenia purpurea var. burkii]
MPSESSDRRQPKLQNGGTHPPEPEHLPCPRCDSTNTKFCYYNNYNLSQPRHFCKSCRRYWTRGGTLRNVPVGGGTRRNPNKRSRSSAGAGASTSSSSSSSSLTFDPIPAANPTTIIPGIKTETASPLFVDVNLNETIPETESYTSLLNAHGGGFFALGGFGVGSGYGFREMGFGGLGPGVWHMEEVSGGGNSNTFGSGSGGYGCSGAGSGSASANGCNAWQIGSVDGGLADGECFGWADLAISTPGKGLK